MNLKNFSRMSAGLTLATDKHGVEHVLAVAKGTFSIGADGVCSLAREQHPMVFADEHHGDPAKTGPRYENDFAIRKPRIDVVVVGHAHAPAGQALPAVDVVLEFGPLLKSARVFGDRIWKHALLRGWRASDPVPFTKMPLVWERAFGGADTTHESPRKHVFETANLVGVGLHGRKHDGIEGTPLPNVEHPKKLMDSPTDRPPPTGFGFVGRGWEPRRRYAGTYDEKWKAERYPFLPLDFDDRWFQGAPEDQQVDRIRPGERVALTGLSPEGRLEFVLPEMEVPIKLVYKDGTEDLPSRMDTVILEPDRRRVLLVWRSSAPIRTKPCHLRQVWVGTPSPGRLRALATGKTYHEWPGRAR